MKAKTLSAFRAPSLAASALLMAVIFGAIGYADNRHHHNSGLSVDPGTFDPYRTKLVHAEWIDGAGCPTGAKQVKYNSDPPYNLLPPSSFTDTACPTGDAKDNDNEGLLFVKTGETLNNAAATAEIDLAGQKNKPLTEIGYDIRSGSHCGAGAPRFNITTTTGKFYFLGCNSPAPTTPSSSLGWRRLRWGNGTAGSVQAYLNGSTLENITDPIKSISMVFDEAQDASGGPDSSGVAILDNIDINTKLVGRDLDRGWERGRWR